ncbi:isoflavone reductase-like [Triticum dicoccoides]|uniref:isoflavone reductase-like n=1 Tax=Triticum dicoccoides TaxID=85692 RepID=UPI00188E114C|nr:isoflavone reductase-like [Triticum dicoccoides]
MMKIWGHPPCHGFGNDLDGPMLKHTQASRAEHLVFESGGTTLLDKEEERSRVLVIGGTGHIGKHIVAASVRRGHPTSVLIRDAAPADLAKAQLLKSFIDSGVALIKGGLFDHGSLVNAIKGADVVISAVGTPQLDEQTRIVMAIKEAGNVIRVSEIDYHFVFFVDQTMDANQIPEADLLKLIKEAAYHLNMMLSHSLSVFVRGDQANFDIEASFGVEATELYPDVKYTTVDEYLDRLL